MSSSPQYGKKMGATLLLGIFLFIYAEKILHRHDPAPVPRGAYELVLKTVKAGCSICEFQSAKDAYLPVLAAPGNLHSLFVKQYIVSTPAYHYLHSGQVPGRGPPVELL